MAFTEVSSLDAENTIALGGVNKKTGKKNPTSAEGYYLGSRKVTNKNGESSLHFLQTPKGNLGVWGKTDMDRKLGAVTPGTMIRISFSGMTPTPRGDMYKFKVEVDNENTIEVSSQSPAATSSYEDSSEDPYGDDEETNDEDEYQAEAAQSAALSALERANKVKALLNKGARK